MEQNQEQNKFSICSQIKQIDPNASGATYLELAKKLSENNLSVGACITYLMQKREEKVTELIKKNFDSEKTESTIKDLYKEQQQKDANEKKGIPLTIHCSPSLDSDIQASIAKKFSEKYRTTIVPTEEFCSGGAFACVLRPSTLHFGVNINGSSFVKLMTQNPKLGINASFKKLSLKARNAVLEHERHHLEANHQILRSLWTSNFDNDIFNEYEEKVRSKLMRAHEAAADRIPAACNDYKLASDFVEYFVELCAGCGVSHLPNNKSFQSHPSNEKRLLWAQRIYNLKLAEQEIKKNFEM